MRHTTLSVESFTPLSALARNEQVEIAVVVVIHQRHARRLIQRRDANLRRHVRELPATIVVKQHHAIAERDGKIVLAVVVVVADGTRDALALQRQPELRRRLFLELALTQRCGKP